MNEQLPAGVTIEQTQDAETIRMGLRFGWFRYRLWLLWGGLTGDGSQFYGPPMLAAVPVCLYLNHVGLTLGESLLTTPIFMMLSILPGVLLWDLMDRRRGLARWMFPQRIVLIQLDAHAVQFSRHRVSSGEFQQVQEGSPYYTYRWKTDQLVRPDRRHQHRIPWGDVDAIRLTEPGMKGELVFGMDDGRHVHASLKNRWWTDRHAAWLVAYLQQRLSQHAPGGPDDIPDVLADMLESVREDRG